MATPSPLSSTSPAAIEVELRSQFSRQGMPMPIRCFGCGRPLTERLLLKYFQLIQGGFSIREALDELSTEYINAPYSTTLPSLPPEAGLERYRPISRGVKCTACRQLFLAPIQEVFENLTPAPPSIERIGEYWNPVTQSVEVRKRDPNVTRGRLFSSTTMKWLPRTTATPPVILSTISLETISQVERAQVSAEPAILPETPDAPDPLAGLLGVPAQAVPMQH